MNLLVQLVTVIVALILVLSARAQTNGTLPVLQALPTAEILGPGWKAEIGVLFDPASNPQEIVNSPYLTERWKKERREVVLNPTNRLAGWSLCYFEFQRAKGSAGYDVEVCRQRSRKYVVEGFTNTVASAQSQGVDSMVIDGVGEAAVACRNSKGMTLWFRRGAFMVSISQRVITNGWDDDPDLRQLARAIDERLGGKVAGSTKQTE